LNIFFEAAQSRSPRISPAMVKAEREGNSGKCFLRAPFHVKNQGSLFLAQASP
jgi:hypothetical protein